MINLSNILRTIHISKFSFYFLFLLIILAFSITFYLLLPNNQLVKDPQYLRYLLLTDVILVIFLLSIIIRQILLVFIYRKFGRSLTNRTHFSKNFIMITTTTMII